MSNDTDEVPIEIKDEEINQATSDESEFIEENNIEENDDSESSLQEIQNLLEKEQQKSLQCEDKLKRTLADFQNLERKSKSDVQNGLNMVVDEFMINFIQIYDDFNRAIDVYNKSKINTEGLNSILKNMSSLLIKYDITPIEALGEIFDPKLHEAISIVEDPSLDDGTITKEIRKGYISQNRIIRPTLVEIAKTSKEKTIGENE